MAVGDRRRLEFEWVTPVIVFSNNRTIPYGLKNGHKLWLVGIKDGDASPYPVEAKDPKLTGFISLKEMKFG